MIMEPDMSSIQYMEGNISESSDVTIYSNKGNLVVRIAIVESPVNLRKKYDRNPLKIKFNITPVATKPFQKVYVESITLDSCKF